jgi:hypothetical protein
MESTVKVQPLALLISKGSVATGGVEVGKGEGLRVGKEIGVNEGINSEVGEGDNEVIAVAESIAALDVDDGSIVPETTSPFSDDVGISTKTMPHRNRKARMTRQPIAACLFLVMLRLLP